MGEAPYIAPYQPAFPEVDPPTHQHASLGGGLSFVDFLPPCIKGGSSVSSAEFERFSILIDYANHWLGQNLAWEVKTCESVEFKAKSEGANFEKMTYCERGEHRTYYMRCLRLWIVPRSDQTCPPQQLAYLNLVPNQVESGGIFSRPNYETLHQLISRYNSQARIQPAPGRLIAIESQEMKASGLNFDPDRSYWYEDGSIGRNFLFIIRLFFEVGPPVSEEIGVADFVPKVSEQGGYFSYPKYEPFASAVAQANFWCSQQSTVRFCNAQTLEIKYRAGRGVDAQEMSYMEQSDAVTFYVRILRVAYVNELAPGGPGLAAPSPPLNLQCKTFVPVQLTKGGFPPDFETLSQTRGRVEAWARITGARVLSCETASLRLSWTGDSLKNVDRGYTRNNRKRTEHWILVLRLYLDGQYQDPPPGEMPPIPEAQELPGCYLL